MKIGKIEGTPEEIKGLFESNNMDLARYIDASQPSENKRRKNIYLFITILSFIAINCIQWIMNLNPEINKIEIIISLVLLCLIIIQIHQKYDKIAISGFTLLMGVLIIGVCLGYLTPREALEELKNESSISEAK